MKKRLLLICTLLLVVVLAIFAFTACDKTGSETDARSAGLAFEIVLIIATVLILVLAYVRLKRLYGQENVFVNFDNTASNDKTPGSVFTSNGKKSGKAQGSFGDFFKNTWVILAGLLLLTFALRLVLMLTTNGLGSSTYKTLQYATVLKNEGIANFVEYYAGLATASPGTLYILNVIGAMGLSSESAAILLRFVNALADMASVAIIYFYGKKYVGNRLSVLFAGLYAALPISFFFGGMNTTFESVLVALMLATVVLLVEKKYLLTYLFLTLAVVLDVRAMLLLPVVVTYFGYMYYKDAQSLRRFTKNRAMIIFGLVGSFVLAYVLTLPVAIHQIGNGDAFFGYKYMARQITSNTLFVDNAFNLYAMVGMNARHYENSAATYLNAAFVCVLEVFAISLYFKNRNRQEIILLVAFIFAMVSTFTLKTNWTYIFLSLAFMLVYAMISGEKRVYLIASGYSLLSFINIAQLMLNSGTVSSNEMATFVNFAEKDGFIIAFSVFSVLLTGYFVYVTYSITNNDKIVDIRGFDGSFKDGIKNLFKRNNAENR